MVRRHWLVAWGAAFGARCVSLVAARWVQRTTHHDSVPVALGFRKARRWARSGETPGRRQGERRGRPRCCTSTRGIPTAAPSRAAVTHARLELRYRRSDWSSPRGARRRHHPGRVASGQALRFVSRRVRCATASTWANARTASPLVHDEIDLRGLGCAPFFGLTARGEHSLPPRYRRRRRHRRGPCSLGRNRLCQRQGRVCVEDRTARCSGASKPAAKFTRPPRSATMGRRTSGRRTITFTRWRRREDPLAQRPGGRCRQRAGHRRRRGGHHRQRPR